MIYPEAVEEVRIFPRASSSLQGLPPLPDPPPIPNDKPVPPVATLARNNPFVYVPGGGSRTQNVQETGLTLLRIQDTSAGLRAQIQSKTARKWYSEGESFETFELLSIDPEEGCCWVFAENLNTREKICIGDAGD